MTASPSLKIGVSGVRGIAGESLTPQIASSFAAAFGTYCGTGPVCIGTDTRPSGEMVTHAATAGLLSVGSTPVDLGIVPLPALQFHVRRTDAVGGICITGSHNPLEWNALKFFGADGIILRPNQFAELMDLYHQGVYPRVRSDRIPRARSDGSAAGRHREGILAAVDVDLIRTRRFKVVIDCCNGAGSYSAPQFLRALGCDVVELNADAGAPFPRDPEPVAGNLEQLCHAVTTAGADLGFAQDADADRLAIVDECGRPLGEDGTVALAVDHVLSRTQGAAVVNLCTSRMIDEIALRHGCEIHRTKVGEVHVVERMLHCRSPIGGEGNGGVIMPEVNPCRDGFVAMALALEALAQRRIPASEIREQWPACAIVKLRIPCRARDAATFLRLARHFYRHHDVDLTDGVLVRWPDRWLHIRASQTEPVLRIIAEAPEEDAARGLARHALEYLSPAQADAIPAG